MIIALLKGTAFVKRLSRYTNKITRLGDRQSRDRFFLNNSA
ncbi:hypothetical protein VCR4J2_250721 [Vibrio coralliirubri]|nr:hypothetical protein VCR4J2_250721 [Vibrio coralliirubri]